METLKDRLRRARKYAGLSQEELANAVGITQGVISHIESGESSGSKHLLFQHIKLPHQHGFKLQ